MPGMHSAARRWVAIACQLALGQALLFALSHCNDERATIAASLGSAGAAAGQAGTKGEGGNRGKSNAGSSGSAADLDAGAEPDTAMPRPAEADAGDDDVPTRPTPMPSDAGAGRGNAGAGGASAGAGRGDAGSGRRDAAADPGDEPAAPDPCMRCTERGCSRQLATCNRDECGELRTCLNECGTDLDCGTRCVDSHPNGPSSLLPLLECQNAVCGPACGVR